MGIGSSEWQIGSFSSEATIYLLHNAVETIYTDQCLISSQHCAGVGLVGLRKGCVFQNS